MKINLIKLSKSFSPKESEVIKSYIQYLQNNLPLKKEISLEFLEKRAGSMTTGVRLPKNKIKILSKNRLLIDILRTLSHEWVHEYQVQKMNVSDKEGIQDVGGPEENMANALSGIFVKKFIKDFPEMKSILFGETD